MSERLMPAPIRDLLVTPTPPELGPGPRHGVELLAALQGRLDDAVRDAGLNQAAGRLVRATVLLWHDHFDPAHAIAQEIETRDGSYVHAILHRREPDYSNAQYWFRRVGVHPCFATLADRSASLLERAGEAAPTFHLVRRGEWDAVAFVAACEAVAGKPASDPQVQLLREIQRAEFEVLLEFLCSRRD